jgi:hypothetical protein
LKRLGANTRPCWSAAPHVRSMWARLTEDRKRLTNAASALQYEQDAVEDVKVGWLEYEMDQKMRRWDWIRPA